MRQFIACLLLIGCLAPAGAEQRSVPAAQRGVPSVPRSQLEARSFLYAIYPELRGQALAVEVSSAARRMRLRVGTATVSPLVARDRVPITPVITADVEYDANDALVLFEATGTLLNAEANAASRQRLRAAGDTALALTTEVGRLGLRTAAAVTAKVPLREIGQVIGTISVRRTTLTSVAQEAGSVYGAVWELGTEARKGSAAQRRYTLQFEPYGGRLVGLYLTEAGAQ